MGGSVLQKFGVTSPLCDSDFTADPRYCQREIKWRVDERAFSVSGMYDSLKERESVKKIRATNGTKFGHETNAHLCQQAPMVKIWLSRATRMDSRV
jgi:hypothetical protein